MAFLFARSRVFCRVVSIKMSDINIMPIFDPQLAERYEGKWTAATTVIVVAYSSPLFLK